MTLLFTDIEGGVRLWEADRGYTRAMRSKEFFVSAAMVSTQVWVSAIMVPPAVVLTPQSLSSLNVTT